MSFVWVDRRPAITGQGPGQRSIRTGLARGQASAGSPPALHAPNLNGDAALQGFHEGNRQRRGRVGRHWRLAKHQSRRRRAPSHVHRHCSAYLRGQCAAEMVPEEGQLQGIDPPPPVEMAPATDHQTRITAGGAGPLAQIENPPQVGIVPAADEQHRPPQQLRIHPMAQPSLRVGSITPQPAQAHAARI